MREIASRMKVYCSLKGNDCRGRKKLHVKKVKRMKNKSEKTASNRRGGKLGAILQRPWRER